MKNFKESFLKDINENLPDGILGLLETPIPEAPSVDVSDVDSAILAQGILAKYLLDFFNTFQGLTPIELLLRIGQKNSTLQAALLLAGRFYEKISHEFNILAPEAKTYTRLMGDDFFCTVEFVDLESFDACTRVGVDFSPPYVLPFELSRGENNTFSANVREIQSSGSSPTASTVRFTASFKDSDDYTKVVDFGVQTPPTRP